MRFINGLVGDERASGVGEGIGNSSSMYEIDLPLHRKHILSESRILSLAKLYSMFRLDVILEMIQAF